MNGQAASPEVDLSLVVGIGASAGGLEALQGFFTHCPRDLGAAFVVVQHLSPDFRSMMDQLLARCTDMPVSVAEDGELARRDHVYLIPPKKSMIIADGHLRLTDTDRHAALNLPIDTFFTSLSEDQSGRAVGIVLSGTGSDGAKGIDRIKEVGGLTMVQSPGQAKFGGMPNAAIATGQVDHSLRVEEIPECIAEHIGHDAARSRRTAEKKAFPDDVFDEICRTVQKHVQIDLRDYKRSTIGRRIDKRASLHQLDNWSSYLELLNEDSKEQTALAGEVLIGVTSFFRDEAVFEQLKADILPDIIRRQPESEEIRVWCAGCSTGEEAYSLAICFSEVMRTLGMDRKLKIFATDIDSKAIHHASVGQYPATIADTMPEDILRRYFISNDKGYVVNGQTRLKAVFARHNLISDPPFSNMDLVVCRNLLIYLAAEAQSRAQYTLNFALNQHAYLMLGPSESLDVDLKGAYQAIDEKGSLYRKVKALRTSLATEQFQPRTSDGGTDSSLAQSRSIADARHNEVLSQAFLALADAHAPPTMIFNEARELIYSVGDCSAYTRGLTPGPSNLNVDSVLAESLVVAVTTAMHKSRREEKPITYTGVIVSDDSRVDVTIRHTDSAVPGGTCVLVSFMSTDRGPEGANEDAAPFDDHHMMQTRIHDLEQELHQSGADLAVTVEQLATSNEELQSSNEELMASNEELQSTNEELQSVNEELYSVNSEYQHKVSLLEETTTDLENLIVNPGVCLLALDQSLRVRHFSPSVTDYFKLIATDVDRSIEDITHQLQGDFAADCRAVLASEAEVSKEYGTTTGRSVLSRITPYIDMNGNVDGVVVSITDVTQLTSLESQKQQFGRARDKLDARRSALGTMLSRWKASGSPIDLNILLIDEQEAAVQRVTKALDDSEVFHGRLQHLAGVAEAQQADWGRVDVLLISYVEGDDELDSFLKERGSRDVPVILLTQQNRHRLTGLPGKGIYDAIDKNDLSRAVLEKSLHMTLQAYQVERFLSGTASLQPDE